MPDATIKEVMEFFAMPTAEFSKQWKELTVQDKMDLKSGIGNGTLTY